MARYVFNPKKRTGALIPKGEKVKIKKGLVVIRAKSFPAAQSKLARREIRAERKYNKKIGLR